MTSRTSPVGVLVIALVSLFAAGCTAQTSAVFEALLEPANAPASSTGADAGSDAAVVAAPGGWWPHPKGYGMALPPGWTGASMTSAQADQLIGAIAATNPALAARVTDVLRATGASLSMVAADTTASSLVSPLIVVLSQPTDGLKPRVVKARTHEQISALPGLRGAVVKDDARLANATGVRFDYFVDDADLGPLQVRSFWFRYSGQAYLVSFIAAESAFDDAELIFDIIADTLRFGV